MPLAQGQWLQTRRGPIRQHEVERGRLLKKLRAGAKTPVVRETFMSWRIRMWKAMWWAHGQDEEVDRFLSKHPLGSIQSQGVRGIGQESEHEWCHVSRLESDVLEEALQASVARIDVGGVWESGGKASQIDGFDPVSSTGQALEQSDADGGQAGDASPVQGKGRLEQVGEHGRMLHGVIS